MIAVEEAGLEIELRHGGHGLLLCLAVIDFIFDTRKPA